MPNADLRSGNGRLSVLSVAELFGISIEQICHLIGCYDQDELFREPDAESLQSSLKPFADIARLRDTAFSDAQFKSWLAAPNTYMSNRAPIAWIREGHVHDVAGFVHGVLSGQPS